MNHHTGDAVRALQVIVQSLLVGHDVTVGVARYSQTPAIRQRVWDVLQSQGVLMTEQRDNGSCVLDNRARLQVLMMDRLYGAACLHSPVLVLLSPHLMDPKARVDAGYILVPFRDGSDGLVMSCAEWG